MQEVINKLKEWGYGARHLEYWILDYCPGLQLWIKIGRKTKHTERVKDWFVRPSGHDVKFRNYDCMIDAIKEITKHVNILNSLDFKTLEVSQSEYNKLVTNNKINKNTIYIIGD